MTSPGASGAVSSRQLAAIGIVAFAMAAWAGATFGPSGDDSRDYLRLANNIALGHGFSLSDSAPYTPSVRRPPVFPFFLAGVHALFGPSVAATLGVQSLLFGLTAVMTAATAAMFVRPRVALVSGVFVAANPYLARWAGAPLTENLFMTLLVATVFFFGRGVARASMANLASAGILWALATLCRPVVLPLLPLMILALWVMRPRVSRTPTAAAIMLCAACLVLGSWTLRNWVSVGRFVPIQTTGVGWQIWLTTIDPEDQPILESPTVRARWEEKYPEVRPRSSDWYDIDAQQEMERALLEASLRRIFADPVTYALGRLQSLPRLWLHSGRLWYGSVSFRTALREGRYGVLCAKIVAALVLSVLPLGFATYGAWLLRSRWREVLPVAGLPAFFLLLHLPMWIEDRYGIPAVPFLLILAAVGATRDARAPLPIEGNT